MVFQLRKYSPFLLPVLPDTALIHVTVDKLFKITKPNIMELKCGFKSHDALSYHDDLSGVFYSPE